MDQRPCGCFHFYSTHPAPGSFLAHPPMPELKALKRKLRERIHVTLRTHAEHEHPQAAEEIKKAFFRHFRDLRPGMIISGTSPIKHEVDPRPLMKALEERGHSLCLPVTVAIGKPLVFRSYSVGDQLQEGVWNIGMPYDDKPVLTPQLLLCPLLAFDRAGRRLGYGGGYYDATLKALRQSGKIVAVGLGFSVQEVEQVPHDADDEKLDLIITEKEIILPKTGQG